MACGHPSDASMENRFVTHESDFEQLLEMSKADSQVARIPAETQNHDAGLSEKVLTEQRLQAYRSLFKKTGLSGGIDRSPNYPGATFFIADYNGVGIKGYVHCDASLSPLVASLDGNCLRKLDRRSTDCLRSNPLNQTGTSTTMNDGARVLSSRFSKRKSLFDSPSLVGQPRFFRFLQMAACAALYISREFRGV